MEVTIMLSAREMRAITKIKREYYTEELLGFIYRGIKECASKGFDHYNTAYILSIFKDRDYDQEYICQTLENLGYQVIIAQGKLYKVAW